MTSIQGFVDSGLNPPDRDLEDDIRECCICENEFDIDDMKQWAGSWYCEHCFEIGKE